MTWLIDPEKGLIHEDELKEDDTKPFTCGYCDAEIDLHPDTTIFICPTCGGGNIVGDPFA